MSLHRAQPRRVRPPGTLTDVTRPKRTVALWRLRSMRENAIAFVGMETYRRLSERSSDVRAIQDHVILQNDLAEIAKMLVEEINAAPPVGLIAAKSVMQPS